jgi:hypothetical protein
LIDLIEELLPPNDELKVKAHIEQCPLCKKELLRLKNTLSILETDAVPPLSPAKHQALFPLVMERVTQSTIRIRRRYKFAYGFGSAFLVIAIFIASIIGFRKQQQTDFYTVFFNPEHVIYSDDAAVNEYVLESLLDDGTVISEVRDVVDDTWINNSELTSLVDGLSEDEIGELIEKLLFRRSNANRK